MKRKPLLRLLITLGCAPVLLSGCNSTPVVGPQGEQGIPGEKGEKGDQGEQGIPGQDGSSVLTGHGLPALETGKTGDSYIDLDSWDYYVREEEWAKAGNIKGKAGDPGVSVSSTQIDDKGDLIVTFSDGQTANAGHVKDVDEYTVKFYCDDLLVDTQAVKHGEKITLPKLDDFTVKHWYVDKDREYEWAWYGCVVTEDMSLYGEYTPISKKISFDKTAAISIDDYGYGEALVGDRGICVSKAVETGEYLTTLDKQGILFNKEEIGRIGEIKLDIAEEGFSAANIYYGNHPLSLDHSAPLTTGTNKVDLGEAEYFTIQNGGSDPIHIGGIAIDYFVKTKFSDESLPTVVINTKDAQAVTSGETYVDCEVSTVGAEKDVSDLKAEIKVRGNSTSKKPKKPYRIKLSKKNSLFGYAKAKNWVLLADYLDGSNMHNYAALKFAKMVRGEETFAVDPLHVNVALNGENVGIYLFGEHIEAKENRLNIEQDNIWEKDFEEINFYIERDLTTAEDKTEIEGTTYFKVDMEDFTPTQYIYALKYPEKEDFEEKLENGEVDAHEAEFQAFFDALKAYMTDISDTFVAYSKDNAKFDQVSAKVDVQSLAEYAAIDQVFSESDHNLRSFKMYRCEGGLLKFGPNWDYDSCAYGLPLESRYVLDPFGVSKAPSGKATWFGDRWGYMLFNDSENGRPLFQEVWRGISNEMIDDFLDAQYEEMGRISRSTMYDCEKWMNNEYYAVFDNQRYYWNWVSMQLPFLKGFYA